MRRGFVTNELLIVGVIFAFLLAIGLGVASGLKWNPLAGIGIAIAGFVLFYLVMAIATTERIRSRPKSETKQDAEQASAGQPSTSPESKSEGSDKPQPESEGRSR